MTPELQKYYEDRFGLMAHKGWADLVEDIMRMRAGIDTLSGIKSNDQLHYRLGMLEVIDWFLNLKNISELAYENLREQTQENKPAIH